MIPATPLTQSIDHTVAETVMRLIRHRFGLHIDPAETPARWDEQLRQLTLEHAGVSFVALPLDAGEPCVEVTYRNRHNEPRRSLAVGRDAILDLLHDVEADAIGFQA